jgi:hypothetical protein
MSGPPARSTIEGNVMRPPYVHLLEVDPALGAGMEPDVLDEARRLAVVPLVWIPRGTWSFAELSKRVGRRCRFGCLITEGLIAHELAFQQRAATELLGRGDLLLPAPAGCMSPDAAYFGVSDLASVAVLDALPALARRWPAIALALLARAERQAGRAALHHAISQLPRAEDRILALFWQLGDRWGTVTDEHVVVPIALGHEAIAQLVGGRRSTISAALGRLAADGLLEREPGGTWTLALRSSSVLDPPPRPPRHAEARLVVRASMLT